MGVIFIYMFEMFSLEILNTSNNSILKMDNNYCISFTANEVFLLYLSIALCNITKYWKVKSYWASLDSQNMRETLKPSLHCETDRFRPLTLNSVQGIPVYLSLNRVVFFLLFKIHSLIHAFSLCHCHHHHHSCSPLHIELANSLNYKHWARFCVLQFTNGIPRSHSSFIQA